ncbi:transmembrane protein 45A-like [Anneissia japonica]|uniref:transmembrane protein 45A-like n=1 Tax=Anneissia japonica TaxID=1529436 RepID=UPI001425B0D8|nr:transmembrane protein 45A-like [Anneissia japonica]
MGSFFGHAASGILFMILASWWTIQRTFNNYYRNYRRTRRKARLPCMNVPFEGILVVFLALSGFIGEQVYKTWKWRIFDNEGNFIYSNIWQHCTMWAAFAFYGAAKIAVATCFKGSERWAQVFLTFAYFIECLLFYFHLHGRTELNVQMHLLEVTIVFMCILFSAGEIWLPADEVLPWLRTWATFVQGSWMLQIGSTLYHPLRSKDYEWDEDDHLNIKFFTMVFAWHCILGTIVVAVQVFVTKVIMKYMCGLQYSSTYTGLEDKDEEEEERFIMETKNNFSDEECKVN